MCYIYIPTVARIFFVIKIIFIVTFFLNCYFPLQNYDTIVSFEKVSFYNIIEKINASQVASILFSEKTLTT